MKKFSRNRKKNIRGLNLTTKFFLCFFLLSVRQLGARIAWLGVAEINFGGAREVYLREFERGTGARKFYKVKSKKGLKFRGIFRPIFRNSNGFSGRKLVIFKKKKISLKFRISRHYSKNSHGFSGRKLMISKKKKFSLKFRGIFRPHSEIQTIFPAENSVISRKKKSLSQKLYEITKYGWITSFFVNFFGVQPLAGGGHKFCLGGTCTHLGGTAPKCSPVAPGLA